VKGLYRNAIYLHKIIYQGGKMHSTGAVTSGAAVMIAFTGFLLILCILFRIAAGRIMVSAAFHGMNFGRSMQLKVLQEITCVQNKHKG
jgi:hypothetical protein